MYKPTFSFTGHSNRYLSIEDEGYGQNGDLEDSIRLFQNVLQALVLQTVPDAAADLIQPAADRAWFTSIAAVTGIPTAVAVTAPRPELKAAIPKLQFCPSPEGLEELYLTHRALRLSRAGLMCGSDADQNVAALKILGAIAAELRKNGLRPAYVSAARRARGALRAGDVTLPDVSRGE